MGDRSRGQWADISELGFVIGMRILFWTYRRLGEGPFNLLLQPVLLYYVCSNRRARRASLEYLQTLKSWDPSIALKVNYATVYRHFQAFAENLLDKLAVWTRQIQHAEVKFHHDDRLLRQLENGEGAILLGSHLGNLEVCRSLAVLNTKLKLNILVHTQNAGKFNRLLEELNDHRELELIEVTTLTPATAILLKSRVARGEFLVIVGDRIPMTGVHRTVEVQFMGRPARFPQGPFILAGLMKCPVYTLFCLKQQGKYEIFCEQLAERVELPPTNREPAIRDYVKRYIERIEQQCRKAPLQWFNFYSFWG